MQHGLFSLIRHKMVFVSAGVLRVVGVVLLFKAGLRAATEYPHATETNGIERWHALITHLFLGARGMAERTFVFVEAVQLHRLLGQNLAVVLQTDKAICKGRAMQRQKTRKRSR